MTKQVLRVGVGGPVGSGKTALLKSLCAELREKYNIAVVTNDIYTREDAQFLISHEALTEDRIIGVETGGCPHTAIREDASMNLSAVEDLQDRFPGLDVVFIVIDVSAGDKIPRKGGPGITKSDLLIINKIDLAPYVGASLEVMDSDTTKMRGDKPYVFSNLKTGDGLKNIISFIEKQGMLSNV